MGLWDGGASTAAASSVAPVVLVAACEVPDGKMPASAARIVAKLLDAGATVRSSFATALVPARRKVGGEFVRVTVARESVAVRFRASAIRGWLTWESDDGGSWSSKACWVWGAGRPASFALTRSAKMAPDAYVLDEVLADVRDGGFSAPAPPEPSVSPKRPVGWVNLEMMPWLRDRWGATKTPLHEPYPCRCSEPHWSPGRYCGEPRNGPSCPCWGREGAALMASPGNCCARRRVR